MVEQNKDLVPGDLIAIKLSLHELNHSIEELTQAIKQLDSTLKKEFKHKAQQPSLQLREAITTLLEYHVNPTYYQDTNFLQLKAAPKIHRKVPSHTNNLKDQDLINQDPENIYLLGLKQAIHEFKKNL